MLDFKSDDRADLELAVFTQILADLDEQEFELCEWLRDLPDEFLLQYLPSTHDMFKGTRPNHLLFNSIEYNIDSIYLRSTIGSN